MSYRQTYLQVVDMVQRGYPRKIIAEYLNLPTDSVNNHIGYARRRGIKVAYDPKAAIRAAISSPRKTVNIPILSTYSKELFTAPVTMRRAPWEVGE